MVDVESERPNGKTRTPNNPFCPSLKLILTQIEASQCSYFSMPPLDVRLKIHRDLNWVSTVLGTFMVFYIWFYFDIAIRKFIRGYLMRIAVVVLSSIAILNSWCEINITDSKNLIHKFISQVSDWHPSEHFKKMI